MEFLNFANCPVKCVGLSFEFEFEFESESEQVGACVSRDLVAMVTAD